MTDQPPENPAPSDPFVKPAAYPEPQVPSYPPPTPYQQPGGAYPPPGGFQQPGPYQPGPYPYQQQSAGTNGMAIASLVLGILWIFWVGSILALIFGYVARNQMRQRPQGGGGLAIAGIVLGWIGIATLLLSIVVGALGN
jgi:Domain of unknown function (DUF4190)